MTALQKREHDKPHLVSFALCPFVRRSVITLLQKGIDFKISTIDLNQKPDWFLKMSPLGLVPILDVKGTVLFESAVINEYLDEVTPPSLHPKDPLEKARHRAYIEYGSALLGDLYVLSTCRDQATFQERRFATLQKLERLGRECAGPFFAGAELSKLSLVDTAFAPALHHIALIKKNFGLDLMARVPKVQAWCDALLALPSVQKSVLPSFEKDWAAYYRQPHHALVRLSS